MSVNHTVENGAIVACLDVTVLMRHAQVMNIVYDTMQWNFFC